MKKYILPLPPNRVRRNYRGGMCLDLFEGKPFGTDGDCPEDWIASTVKARNPGLPEIANEGLACVKDNDGRNIILKDLLERFPEHYLGKKHFEKLGAELGFLAKLLDSSMRLHVQAHPTSAFAQKYLNSRWGKLETYVIMGVRNDIQGYIRLGFQHAPSEKQWHRIVFEQDITAMDACFDKIPVKPNEVWIVSGGLPHAIGEGLFVLEVMEPTDLVVRCEFEREGIVVPPQARFMGHKPEFAMKIFDYTKYTAEEVGEKFRIKPIVIEKNSDFRIEQLIGRKQTECFEIFRINVLRNAVIKKNNKLQICVVAQGSGMLEIEDEQISFAKGSRFLIASSAKEMVFHTEGKDIATILTCCPGTAAE